MRLKQGCRNQAPVVTEELQGLLKNQRVNRQYEEGNLWSRTTTTNTTPRPIALTNTTNSNRVQQVWTGQQIFRSQRSPTNTTNLIKTTNVNNSINFSSKNQNLSRSYDSSPVSPLDEDSSSSDQAMSLSSPEESPSQANGISEEDSLSDLEYNESSPLLCPDDLSSDEEHELAEKSTEDNLNISKPNSRTGGHRRKRKTGGEVESEDSMFSDSSCDMSDSKDSACVMENNLFMHHHNNNNPTLTTVINSQSINRNYYRGTSRVDQVFTETVQPVLQPVAVTCRPHPPARIALKTDVIEAVRVLSLDDPVAKEKPGVPRSPKSPSMVGKNLKLELLDVGKSPSCNSPEAGMDTVSPMSDTSSNSDVDINMASGMSLNNISMPGSKENGIQCLFKKDPETALRVNIVEKDKDKATPKSPDELKILNTVETVDVSEDEKDETEPLLTRGAGYESDSDKRIPKLPVQVVEPLIEQFKVANVDKFLDGSKQEALDEDIFEYGLPSNQTIEYIPVANEDAVSIECSDELEVENLKVLPLETELITEVEMPANMRSSLTSLGSYMDDEDPFEKQEHNFLDSLTSDDELELQKEPVPIEFGLLPRDDFESPTEPCNTLSLASELSLAEAGVQENYLHIDELENDNIHGPLPEPVDSVCEVDLIEGDRIREFAASSPMDNTFERRYESSRTIDLTIKTPTKQAVVKPYRYESDSFSDSDLIEVDSEYEQKMRDLHMNDEYNKRPSPKAFEENVINNNDSSAQNDALNSANLEDITKPDKETIQATEEQQNGSSRKRSVKSKRTSSSSHQPPLHQNDLNGDFDVYNIETAMPTIDWEAMEEHLTRAAKENDWLMRRRNDREEIRRKLAMDSDSEEYYCGERVTRKPSLTTRLQSGMNLQICFMNETASDLDSQGSDQDSENGNPSSNKDSPTDQRISSLIDTTLKPCSEIAEVTRNGEVPNQNKISSSNHNSICSTASSDSDSSSGPWKLQQKSEENVHQFQQQKTPEPKEQPTSKRQRPSFFFSRQKSWRLGQLKSSQKKLETQSPPVQKCAPIPPEEDFLTRHARLQAEARHALSQAKEMARMQMEVERQRKKKSPIADIVGIPFSDGRHRLSRQLLTDMNVAQLQVIVNDLHSQIESLNEDLVRLLLERDDLNMEQDSMLVDIEDMTRFLGAKDEALKTQICPKMAGLK